jgi:RES domain-containing protein
VSTEVSVWRIGADTPEYEAHDLCGTGAEETGGRWNRKGVRVVYASGSRALACLETVVHLASGEPLPLNRYLVEIRIPLDLWNARALFDPASHVGWDAEPAGKVSIEWGSAWVQRRTTLLAEVPSVIVPEEQNVLVNPEHPGAGRLTAVKIRRWTYDWRLE